MVAANAAGSPMLKNVLKEQRKNGSGAIVIIGADTSDKTRIAINEGMYDNPPTTQA
jgi:hypothetical protein